MSTAQRDALRDKVEPTVGAFVEASIAASEEAIYVAIDLINSRISSLEAQALDLQDKVNKLTEASEKPADTDKYALTKSKMIKMMKEMGYYD